MCIHNWTISAEIMRGLPIELFIIKKGLNLGIVTIEFRFDVQGVSVVTGKTLTSDSRAYLMEEMYKSYCCSMTLFSITLLKTQTKSRPN